MFCANTCTEQMDTSTFVIGEIFQLPILNSYAKTQLRSQTSSYVILFLFVFTAKRLLINLLTCGLTLLRSRGEGIKNRLDLVKV